MPVFECGVHRTASSASLLSPWCADVLVKVSSHDTRSAWYDTQRHSLEKHSPEDSSENGRMLGKDGRPKPSEKGRVLHTFSWESLGQFMFGHVWRCTKPPSLTEKSANLKKREKMFSLLHQLLYPCPFTPLTMASAARDGPTCCSISGSSAPLHTKDGVCPCRGAPTKQW